MDRSHSVPRHSNARAHRQVGRLADSRAEKSERQGSPTTKPMAAEGTLMSAPSSMRRARHTALSVAEARLEWPSRPFRCPRSTNAPSPHECEYPCRPWQSRSTRLTRHGVIQIGCTASTCGWLLSVPLSQDIHETIAKEGSFEDPAAEEHMRHSRWLIVAPCRLRNCGQVSGHGDVRLVGQPELAEARRATPFRSVVHCAPGKKPSSNSVCTASRCKSTLTCRQRACDLGQAP